LSQFNGFPIKIQLKWGIERAGQQKLRKSSCISRALLAACRRAVEVNLGCGADENIVILGDSVQQSISEAFEEACRDAGLEVEILEIPVLNFNGEEPPDWAAGKLLKSNVALLTASRSMSWTSARGSASAKGVRVASMPGITEDIILRTFVADYERIRERVNRIDDLLDQGKRIRVTTPAGTDINFSIENRLGRGRKGGIYRDPGAWGNLPCGEAFIAPLEGTAEGCYVVDASQAGVGKIEENIEILVVQGRAVEFSGGPQAFQMEALLRSTGTPQAFNLAEFGIGCNDRATIIGKTLEDEKSLGTCHFALGSNHLFGGCVNVPIHLDGVLRRPCIWIDGRQIMDEGQFLVEV
jgi:leucyl aminopeptidase (aminopeptidase T)